MKLLIQKKFKCYKIKNGGFKFSFLRTLIIIFYLKELTIKLYFWNVYINYWRIIYGETSAFAIIFLHTYYFELKIDSSRGFIISSLSSKLNPNYIAYNCYIK